MHVASDLSNVPIHSEDSSHPSNEDNSDDKTEDLLSNLTDDVLSYIFEQLNHDDLDVMCLVSTKMFHFASQTRSRIPKGEMSEMKIYQNARGDFVVNLLNCYETKASFYAAVKMKEDQVAENSRGLYTCDDDEEPEEIGYRLEHSTMGNQLVPLPELLLISIDYLLVRYWCSLSIHNVTITASVLSVLEASITSFEGMNLVFDIIYFADELMQKRFYEWIVHVKPNELLLTNITDNQELCGGLINGLVGSCVELKLCHKQNTLRPFRNVSAESIASFAAYDCSSYGLTKNTIIDIIKIRHAIRRSGYLRTYVIGEMTNEDVRTALNDDFEVLNDDFEGSVCMLTVRLKGSDFSSTVRISISNWNDSYYHLVNITFATDEEKEDMQREEEEFDFY